MGNGGMGFSKDGRNYQEREFDCAVEMLEETGYSMDNCTIIRTYFRSRENFGSNYKSININTLFMNLTNAKPSGEFSRPR
jgi:hypothetical protein